MRVCVCVCITIYADAVVCSRGYFDKAIFTVGPPHLLTAGALITLPTLRVSALGSVHVCEGEFVAVSA